MYAQSANSRICDISVDFIDTSYCPLYTHLVLHKVLGVLKVHLLLGPRFIDRSHGEATQSVATYHKRGMWIGNAKITDISTLAP